MAATIKPSGISIVRDANLKFVISWKIADKDYGGGHQFRYRTWTSEKKYSNWTESTMGASATTKTVTLTASNWFPAAKKPKLFYFEVEIRGKRATAQGKSYEWSAWTGKKWKLAVPKRPEFTTTLNESNETTFFWDAEVDTKDVRPFADVEYQTILVKACKEKDGSKLKWRTTTLGWATGTGTSSSQVTKTENTTLLAENSYTRWVRARARGARGASEWRYAKHVYARPHRATISKATATVRNNTTNVYVKWTAEQDAAHPIDETVAEYYIGTPGSGLAFPSGATPSVGATLRDTSGTDAANFLVDDTVGLDECLFVRVNTKHDSNTTTSAWKMVKAGKLTKPTGDFNISWNSSTRKVSVSNLTNGSDVPDSKMALLYRGKGSQIVVGIIAHGDSSITNVLCPDDGVNNPQFGVYAFQGTSTETTRADNVKVYAVDANMKSAGYYKGGSVPAVPGNVNAAASGREGEVILTWDWSWEDANQAEISWSKNEFAWESTDEPSTYVVNSTHAAQWRVSGLEMGAVWYFRIRLLQTEENSTIYGEYSETQSVDLTSAPHTPVLSISAAVVQAGGELTASWEYEATDGTQQASAEICIATVDDTETVPISYGTIVGNAMTAQHATIKTTEWTLGETYYLCVRVTSESGAISPWSDPVPVSVAEPISIDISDISLETKAIGDRSVLTLTEMPLTVTITGAGAGGITTLIIERADDYSMIRPDDSAKDGFSGETICFYRQTGEAEIGITQAELIGLLDDGASYNLIATVEDGFGQSASETLYFEVHWDHQAGEPDATVTIEDNVAVITVTAPDNYAEGDTCDIYRLSVDKPQLIVKGGTFGIAYVDPYPALGENAGYRCVCITGNGDYITDENKPAWVNVIGELLDNKTGIIDFNGESIPIQYNVTHSASWKKDFKETKYLHGTVRGDWNPAVSRTGTINVTIPTKDTERIQAMRRLADWSGICHVRSQDGSSYSADIQVSSNTSYRVAGKVEEFTLNVTRIEPETLDGLPYSEWVSQ